MKIGSEVAVDPRIGPDGTTLCCPACMRGAPHTDTVGELRVFRCEQCQRLYLELFSEHIDARSDNVALRLQHAHARVLDRYARANEIAIKHERAQRRDAAKLAAERTEGAKRDAAAKEAAEKREARRGRVAQV
jgi:hypothetical protein